MNPHYNRSQDPFTHSTLTTTVAQASTEARLDFIRKTYVLFMAGILMSIVGGVVSLRTPLWQLVLSTSPFSFLSLFLFVMVARGLSRTPGLNYAALFSFTLVTGILFAPILMAYESLAPGVVTQAAFLTVIVFGSLTAYAFISRQDFSYLGGMLFVALIALILGGLANLFFFHSSAMAYWSAWITLLLFSGFVLYDTSRIIQRYDMNDYCGAALELFLDFFNMFLAILRILSGSRR
ncbi:MAG: Bax inhibitor-1 family protein [Abitibacteriaceae bacterium]|nr:Bax inhibitor-1 family protein [Abditibacteriaceae bacterium]